MGETTISWTDYTFNPWIGCHKVSPGCMNCYAETMVNRRTNWGVIWGNGKTSNRKRTSKNTWENPIKWNREAEKSGRRARVFCASLADVFEDRTDVTSERKDLFDLIKKTPWLDWLLLTKRPENIESMLPPGWIDGWDNVWLGTSVEDQKRYDERVDVLLSIKSKIHFLSAEPLLEEVKLRHGVKDGLNWIIVGGESGHGWRTMDVDWARKLRDDAQRLNVTFFFKQHSALHPQKKGFLLDGKQHHNWPVSPASAVPKRGRPKVSALSRAQQLLEAQKTFRKKNAHVRVSKDRLTKIDNVVGADQRVKFVNDAIDKALQLHSAEGLKK